MEVSNIIKGTINEMSYETGSPIPYIDGVEVSIGSILRVDTGTSYGSEDDQAGAAS